MFFPSQTSLPFQLSFDFWSSSPMEHISVTLLSFNYLLISGKFAKKVLEKL